jgi:hypothetical protein
MIPCQKKMPGAFDSYPRGKTRKEIRADSAHMLSIRCLTVGCPPTVLRFRRRAQHHGIVQLNRPISVVDGLQPTGNGLGRHPKGQDVSAEGCALGESGIAFPRLGDQWHPRTCDAFCLPMRALKIVRVRTG